jgi:hypothetical protein
MFIKHKLENKRKGMPGLFETYYFIFLSVKSFKNVEKTLKQSKLIKIRRAFFPKK